MKTKIMILFFLLFTMLSLAQPFGKHQRGPKERIQELERIKLLEVLDLNEEDAVRFFSRRSDFLDNQQILMDDRDELLLEMELAIRKDKSIEDFDYESSINKLSKYEKQIDQQREKFLNSLSDLLDEKQITKLIVFESKFRQEIRDVLMRRRGQQ